MDNITWALLMKLCEYIMKTCFFSALCLVYNIELCMSHGHYLILASYSLTSCLSFAGGWGICPGFWRAWYCGVHSGLSGLFHAKRKSCHLLRGLQYDSTEGKKEFEKKERSWNGIHLRKNILGEMGLGSGASVQTRCKIILWTTHIY